MTQRPESFSVDFSKVDLGGGKPGKNSKFLSTIDTGEYRVRIAEIERTESKAGNDMFVLTYEFLDYPYQGKRSKKDYVVLTPKALWKLRAIGKSTGLAGNFSFDQLYEELLGKKLMVTFEDDEYDGRPTYKASSYAEVDGGNS